MSRPVLSAARWRSRGSPRRRRRSAALRPAGRTTAGRQRTRRRVDQGSRSSPIGMLSRPMRAGRRVVRLRLEPGHRHRRPRPRHLGRRPAQLRRKRLPPPSPGSSAGPAGGASAYVRTPAGGMHGYFTGSHQHNGRLPSHHLDLRSSGGYILARPPGRRQAHRLIKKLDGHDGLDWAAVIRLLEPQRQQQQPEPRLAPSRDLSHLVRWVASQPEGRPVLGRQPRPGRRSRRRPEPPRRRWGARPASANQRSPAPSTPPARPSGRDVN